MFETQKKIQEYTVQPLMICSKINWDNVLLVEDKHIIRRILQLSFLIDKHAPRALLCHKIILSSSQGICICCCYQRCYQVFMYI